MREILFRGKTIKEGNWIEGSLIIDEKDNYYIGKYIESKGNCSYYCTNRRNGKTINRFIGVGFAMVDKDTVCEYTGLTDKNGKKIFEGDIIKDCDYEYIHAVRYFGEEDYPAFDCYPEIQFCDCNGLSHLNEANAMEVIGNIHDNGELLTAERSEK